MLMGSSINDVAFFGVKEVTDFLRQKIFFVTKRRCKGDGVKEFKICLTSFIHDPFSNIIIQKQFLRPTNDTAMILE